MKEKFTNNLFLKLSSIVVAIIVWLVVIDISDPIITMTKTVPLQINGENIISSAGKSYTLNAGNVVTISYKVRTKDRRKIATEDFKASIDLGQLYDVTGAVPVNVEVLDKSNYIIGTPTSRPSVISVSTEDIQKKEFKLVANVKGKASEGYSVGDIKLEPSSVYLNGPVSLIGRVSSIGVELDISGASADLNGNIKPIFYDANGNKINIDDPAVYFDEDNIKYKISMLKGKMININFNISGEVEKGYRFIGLESSQKTISITGAPNELNTLNSVEIPSNILNLNNLSSDKTINFDIAEFLLIIFVVNGSSQISVTLKVVALMKKSLSINLNDIIIEGGKEEYQYKINPEKINLVISGIENDLNKLNIRDINAKINVAGLTKGEHNGNLKLNLPKDVELETYTPFELIIFEKNDKNEKESVVDKESGIKENTTKESISKDNITKESIQKESVSESKN